MRVPNHLVESRREQLAQMLSSERYLPVAEICKRLSISEATARRDLVALETNRRIQRTFGGAVAFYNARFPSFRQRLGFHAAGKKRIARRAASFIRENMTVFLDTGTTTFLLAEELTKACRFPFRAVTANIPVAELLADSGNIDVHLLGGQLVARQSVLLGPACRVGLAIWNFDIAFLSAEGLTVDGLWNSQAEIVEIQKEALRRSTTAFALIDKHKFGVKTPHFLAPPDGSWKLLTDASADEAHRAGLPRELLC